MKDLSLHSTQARLVERGVRDIKFAFNEDVASHPREAVGASLCRVINAHLDGKSTALAPLGDKPIQTSHQAPPRSA